METEIEAKFLNVNINSLRKTLKSLKTKLIHPEIIMHRKNFDYPNKRLQKIGGWIRVRNEGDKITLSYKQLNDRTLHGTKEVTINVNDFDKTCLLLSTIGFKQSSYQETKREKWLLDKCEITIDTWPWVPTFIEIESNDEESVKNVSKKLGFKLSNAMHGSVEIIYQTYYNVTEDEVDKWEAITFTPIPNWLENKRINSH